MADIVLSKLDHLWDSLGREDGQQVGNENEPILLSLGCASGLDPAESDALALIRASSPSIDQRRMEAVHIEMLIVDEEALAHRGVAVLVRLQVELDLIRQQGALVGTDDMPLVREDGAAMPVLLLL